MRFTDVNIYGVLISPFVPMMLVAAAIAALLRWAMLVTGLPRVWHPALFDVSLYVIVLCLVVLAVGSWTARV